MFRSFRTQKECEAHRANSMGTVHRQRRPRRSRYLQERASSGLAVVIASETFQRGAPEGVATTQAPPLDSIFSGLRRLARVRLRASTGVAELL
jgi:hypothetical protein